MYGNRQTDWSDALPDLRKVGYRFLERGRAYRQTYYEMFRKASETKKLKIHARSYQNTHRYLEGISVGLLDEVYEVDEFVFWFERERVLFTILTEWLRAVKDDCGQSIKIENGQWHCNLRPRDGALEVIRCGSWDIPSNFCLELPQ